MIDDIKKTLWATADKLRANMDKYPPDQQDAAVELVLQQAKALGEAWACSEAIMKAMTAKPFSSAVLFGWRWRKPSA